MKRLTERRPNGVIHVDFIEAKESVMSRLAAIEDILGDEYDLDRLRKLVEADRDGKCVILPDSYYRDERAAMKAREQDE